MKECGEAAFKKKPAPTKPAETPDCKAAEIEAWVRATEGPFHVTALRRDLGLDGNKKDRDHVAQILLRLKRSMVIEATGKRAGEYRLLVKDMIPVNWKDAVPESMELTFPFGIEKLVNIYPKSVMVIAGRSNAGKTAFLLDFVKRNMGNYVIHYFSSEMGESEARRRLELHEDVHLESWDFKMWDRAAHFADVIQANAVNIIDYLESLEAEEYKVKAYISQIWQKLDRGVALIAIQKNKGRDIGRGGEATLDRARLYIAIDDGIIKIVKAKNWATFKNPNGLIRKFKLVQGWNFIGESDWMSVDEARLRGLLPEPEKPRDKFKIG